MKLSDEQLQALYKERCKIEKFCTPPQKTVAEIVRENWIALAFQRKAEIDNLLADHFFPEPPEEGTHRKDVQGFHVMLKPSVSRVFDLAALPVIEKKLTDEQRENLIEYKPVLKLKNYRDANAETKAIIDNAIIKTPSKTDFEITEIES